MYVNCYDPVFGTFAQYDRSHRDGGGGRKARRLREIEAHAAGVRQQPALLAVLDAEALAAEIGLGVCHRHGAPGLWGAVPNAEALAARKAVIRG